ncbi:hypothetical protein MJM83_29185, partial [Salmonella enterica subsp. enterica serovar Montevideo]|nr:hypothetical protein [Salmonella enterica subsp. enterica serovar Montevideo]
MVVCWGGHSINENEYLYARRVGTQLGLRELNICTGCGPGAMEGTSPGYAIGRVGLIFLRHPLAPVRVKQVQTAPVACDSYQCTPH